MRGRAGGKGAEGLGWDGKVRAMSHAMPLSVSRSAQLDSLEREVLDVLVVGGGIVGAGVARDAAMRGLSVAVIDQYDFAFGTSSRSSRLLHGGLRYLAQGRVGMVREASREKVTLSRIAPHLAQPLAFIFPTYQKSGWPRWKLRIGVKVYDWLCGAGNLGRSGGLSRKGVLDLLPGLEQNRLTGGVRYFDAFTNDARLVLDTIRSAAASGARAVNYLSLESAGRVGAIWNCQLRCTESDRRVAARAKVVVNAAGAWASRFSASRVKLRLTKGVHVVIDGARLGVAEAVVMTDGPRILFAIPWGERVILGTTDTDYDGPIDAPDCTAEDVAYVLGIVNRTFPSAGLKQEDVISAWSGLRPLLAGPKGKPSDISRAHQIISGEPGWFDVAGGKLTTYRLMAEQTVDRAMAGLGMEARPCRTAAEPILSERGDSSGLTPPPVARGIVEHYCLREWARHLDDVMVRRTGWRFYHRDQMGTAREVAGWMGEALGWDREQMEVELRRYEAMTWSMAMGWIPPDSPGNL